jgi:hypothetical protein
MKHHYVADTGMIDQTVGEDALTDRQGGLHRAARDAVGLDDERLDQQRKSDRDRDRGYELDQPPHRF